MPADAALADQRHGLAERFDDRGDQKIAAEFHQIGARLGCANDRGEAIAEACKTKRSLPCSTQGNEPFRGEIRSKALTVWREIETATVEETRLMRARLLVSHRGGAGSRPRR